MGLLDFLYDWFGGGGHYQRLAAWCERRIGPTHKSMSEGEIGQYVNSLATTGKGVKPATLEGFRQYIRRRYGRRR